MAASLLIDAKGASRSWFGVMLALLLPLRGTTQAQTAETPSPSTSSTNATAGALTVGWPKNRFIVFSNSAIVPPIQVVSNADIQVGGCRVTGLSQAGGNRKLVAMQLGVPVGLVDHVLERFAKNPQLEDSARAQELRGATIEFRFLLAEMTGYNPPPEGQPAKTNALQALLLGDLSTAWAAYVQLPRPSPPAAPSGFRIIAVDQ